MWLSFIIPIKLLLFQLSWCHQQLMLATMIILCLATQNLLMEDH